MEILIIVFGALAILANKPIAQLLVWWERAVWKKDTGLFTFYRVLLCFMGALFVSSFILPRLIAAGVPGILGMWETAQAGAVIALHTAGTTCADV